MADGLERMWRKFSLSGAESIEVEFSEEEVSKIETKGNPVW